MQSTTKPLPAVGSAFLDVLRFSAAIVVFIAHFSHPDYLDHGVYRYNWGVYAVGIFFVLSGFVIRFITRFRPTTVRSFLTDRLSRIYSVLVPSLLFTLLATAILTPQHFAHDLLASIVNFFALGELWGKELLPSSNPVYWSLCYECFYYVFYGIGFFMSGSKRIFWLLAVALLVGSPILVLLPLWLMGAAVYDLYERLDKTPERSLKWLAVIGVVASIAAAGAHTLHLQNSALLLSAKDAGHPLTQFIRDHHYRPLLRSNPKFYVSGIITSYFVLVVFLLDKSKIDHRAKAIVIIRRIADGTFALYLFHVPMLMLIRRFIPYSGSSAWQRGLIAIGVISLSVYIQGPLDQLRAYARRRYEKKPAPVLVKRPAPALVWLQEFLPTMKRGVLSLMQSARIPVSRKHAPTS